MPANNWLALVVFVVLFSAALVWALGIDAFIVRFKKRPNYNP